MDVLVIGGIFREVLDGDTDPRRRYGGSGLVASVAAARFGARVALASYVGAEDEEAVRSELQLAGVDHSAVLSVVGASGTFVFPALDDPKRPWPMYRPAEAFPEDFPQVPEADVVVVFGIPDFDPVALGWLSPEANYETVIWDRQGWLSRARDASAVIGLKARRRIYMANELEAIEDACASSFQDALAEQPPRGFDAAVVKRGAIGVTVIEAEGGIAIQTTIPAFPVRTSSYIGSGDIFAGVFAARLAAGEPIDASANWGCAAAAVSLTGGQNLLTANVWSRASELISGQC